MFVRRCVWLHPSQRHGILSKHCTPQVPYRPCSHSDLPQTSTSSFTGSRIRGSLLLGTYFCRITCFSSSWLGALRGRASSWEETKRAHEQHSMRGVRLPPASLACSGPCGKGVLAPQLWAWPMLSRGTEGEGLLLWVMLLQSKLPLAADSWDTGVPSSALLLDPLPPSSEYSTFTLAPAGPISTFSSTINCTASSKFPKAMASAFSAWLMVQAGNISSSSSTPSFKSSPSWLEQEMEVSWGCSKARAFEKGLSGFALSGISACP